MPKVILLLILFISLYADNGFMSAEKLNSILNQKNIVLVDISSQKDYQDYHIPHAVHTKISSWRKPILKHQLMRSSQEIQTEMRRLGINNNSQVVIYGHNKKKSVLESSYIALAMIVNGAKNVTILNGAFAEWEDDDDRPLESGAKTNKIGNFTASFNKNIVVDMNYTKAHIGKVPMLEARPAVFYYGSLRSSGVKHIGHIPKAMSSFWKDKFQLDGTLQSEDILKEIVLDGYNLNKNQEVILYCTGGLEASMNWFVLSQHMGFKNAKIYDGSMREWANRDDMPIVRYKWETFGY